MDKPNFKTFNVRLTPEMHEFLKVSAEKRGLTMNAMVIFALETYFNQQQVLPHIEELLELERQHQNK